MQLERIVQIFTRASQVSHHLDFLAMSGVQAQVLINAAIATVGQQKRHPRTCVFKGTCQTYYRSVGLTGVLANDVVLLLASLTRNRAMTPTQAPPIPLRPSRATPSMLKPARQRMAVFK